MPHSPILTRYADRVIPRGLSVATVADFVDSHEHLHALATAAGDLKDVQRPWMLKAVLGTVPVGGQVCEIGAGEPLVAGALAGLGYRVTVVDPYDGSGNGPTQLAHFRASAPNVRFIDRPFAPDVPGIAPGELDAVYSISVLEHLDAPALTAVVAAARQFLRPGGIQMHAIDFVAAGAGADYHRRMLELFLANFGVTAAAIDDLVRRAMQDTETYFLSAEAHNRWRGATPYASFPMRKVISIHWVL